MSLDDIEYAIIISLIMDGIYGIIGAKKSNVNVHYHQAFTLIFVLCELKIMQIETSARLSPCPLPYMIVEDVQFHIYSHN